MAEPKIIKINPVTRIEGHAKISLFLDSKNEVSDAQFHVDEFRGFEKFCEGRLYTEYRELFSYTLFPGLGLLLLEMILACTRFRSLP